MLTSHCHMNVYLEAWMIVDGWGNDVPLAIVVISLGVTEFVTIC